MCLNGKHVANLRKKVRFYFARTPIFAAELRNLTEMKESTRILRFAIVGTMNAAIAALVIWVLMDLLGCNYLWANMAGYAASLINNFLWSKYWVFASRQSHFAREIPLFLFAFGSAYTAQFLFLLLAVEGIGLNAYLGQFLGLFVYGAVNFILNRKVTFKQQ